MPYVGNMAETRTDDAPEPAAAGSDREDRLRREREMLARGIAQLEAGQGLTGEALDAWLDALESGEELPLQQAAPTP